MAESSIRQSVEVAQAAWLADRLAPFASGMATSVVPDGFAAYARLLHPLNPVVHGQPPARWAHVAAWSEVALMPGIDFPDIAFPDHEPSGAEPWPGQVPEVGTLRQADVKALAALLTLYTSTPDRTWFCTWEGWGSVSFNDGPRVELPGRNYVLFTGPLTELPFLMDAQDGHSPNLWWPDDRAWCVATEIDLAWTYVGGPAALISDVLRSPHLEAQPASREGDFRQRAPTWLTPLLQDAVVQLLTSGTATVHTWRGSVHAQLEPPRDEVDGDLRFQRRPSTGRPGSSWQRVTERDPERLRDNVTTALTREIIELL